MPHPEQILAGNPHAGEGLSSDFQLASFPQKKAAPKSGCIFLQTGRVSTSNKFYESASQFKRKRRDPSKAQRIEAV
ncbi:MAG: hypothetical protein WCS65_11840 [Verrucomicrobiae bacterium]